MPYVKFSSNNYSTDYTLSVTEEDPDFSSWYEVPSRGAYKLVDGVVQECSFEEHENSFIAGRKPPYMVELKNYVAHFLNDTDWLVQRHREQVETEATTSLTAEEYTQLTSYRQYLRELSNNFQIDFTTTTLQPFSLNNKYSYTSYQFLVDFFSRQSQ